MVAVPDHTIQLPADAKLRLQLTQTESVNQSIGAAPRLRLFTSDDARWTALMIAVLFIGGVQLFCIGILGEYIGRIYENVKGRPPSVVSKTLGVENPVKTRKGFRA